MANNEPAVTLRIEGEETDRRFSRPLTAARFLLSLCIAEELQALKLDQLRWLQQRLRVVTHEGDQP